MKLSNESPARRNQEHEGFFRSFFVFFIYSWWIFTLSRASQRDKKTKCIANCKLA